MFYYIEKLLKQGMLCDKLAYIPVIFWLSASLCTAGLDRNDLKAEAISPEKRKTKPEITKLC